MSVELSHLFHSLTKKIPKLRQFTADEERNREKSLRTAFKRLMSCKALILTFTKTSVLKLPNMAKKEEIDSYS